MSLFKLFECSVCNYMTDIKSNYQKHLDSKKHFNNTNLVKKRYVCSICNGKFNNNVSLWRHRKKHNHLNNLEDYSEEDFDIDIDGDIDNNSYDNSEVDSEDNMDINSDDEFERELDRKFNGKENITMLQMMQQMCEQNMQLKEQLQEQQKEFNEQQQKTTEIMMELVKTNTSNNNNNINNNIAINSNNTSNTNNFNLNFFLNETCKDAMSIDDFLDSIEITITDLKRLGKEGYVAALSTLLIDNLKEIDITKRPIHCSDLKRETIYIRDLKGWEKENSHKVRLHRVLNEITRLNTIALQGIYQKAYPHCLTDHKSKEHKEYGEIAYNAFGGKGDIDKLNKIIIHNLVKEIRIQK